MLKLVNYSEIRKFFNLSFFYLGFESKNIFLQYFLRIWIQEAKILRILILSTAKGTFMSRTCHFINEGLLEIMFTFPLTFQGAE